jgi:DNA primase
VQNVVAPQGTAFTADHARILRRYIEEVVLCFDSDEAGQNAAVRSLDSLLASGLAVRVAMVPAPHDPDSYIKAFGGTAFKQLIAGAEGFFDYYLNRLTAINDVTSDKGRLAVLRAMAESVHTTGNGVLVDTYAQKTALRLGVTPDAVRGEFSRLARKKAPAAPATETPVEPAPAPQRPSAPEYWLLKLLLLHDDLAGWAAEHLDPGWVQHSQAREIVVRRLAAHSSHTWTSLAAFLDECEAPEMRSLITEATAEQRPIPNPAQQLPDIALRLRNQFIDRQLGTLMQRTNQPDCSDTERLELLRQQQELRQLKRQPLQPDQVRQEN